MIDEKATSAVPIGAVTRLTGLSGHTLRKWESRYHAIEPERTDTGRRLYTPAHIRRLRLLRDLIKHGHPISQLAGMSDGTLEALLADRTPAPDVTEPQFDEAVIVGEVLTTMLREELGQRPVTFVPEPGARWLAHASPTRLDRRRVLVVELQTLPDDALSRVIELRREVFSRVIVVYRMASQTTLRRLIDGGVVCLKAPVTAPELLRNLQLPEAEASVIDLVADRAVPAHRFSTATLARLAALSPKLQCECPNHIAQLLLDISAFEQYSLECEDADPAERALHARLRIVAAHARALFEEAMVAVAVNEAIPLEDLELPGT